jgi:hypothetical protein
MHPQSKIHALFLGVLLPYIALVMFFARRHPGQAPPIWLIYLGMACIVAIIVESLIVRRAHVRSTDKNEYSLPERKLPKTIWSVLNVCLFGLGVWQGYASLAPEQLRHVNPDAVFCGSLLRRATGSVAFWMIATYFCAFFGLVIVQVLVYRVYRERVIAAH